MWMPLADDQAGGAPLCGAPFFCYDSTVQHHLTGFHAIQEALRAGGSDSAGLRLLVEPHANKPGPRIREILEEANAKGVPVSATDRKTLDRIAPGHRGIALEIDPKSSLQRNETHLEDFLAEPRDSGLALLLDHIEDPQNFGAILRSADAFAVDLVLATARRSAPLSEAAVKASAGAAAWVPLAEAGNLGEAVRKLKKAGFWVYAADMDGQDADKSDLPAKCAIVLGNEGSGVSRLVRDLCDGAISIPMRGHVDSLNVSAAAAVLLYEYRRSHPA